MGTPNGPDTRPTVEDADAAGLTTEEVNVNLMLGNIAPPGPDAVLGRKTDDPEVLARLEEIEAAVAKGLQGQGSDIQ